MVSPIGKATEIAITVVNRVPEINGIIPKCLLANNGVHWSSVRNSIIETSLKKVKLSDNKTQIIPTVVRMVIAALNLSKNSIIFSLFILKQKKSSCNIILQDDNIILRRKYNYNL